MELRNNTRNCWILLHQWICDSLLILESWKFKIQMLDIFTSPTNFLLKSLQLINYFNVLFSYIYENMCASNMKFIFQKTKENLNFWDRCNRLEIHGPHFANYFYERGKKVKRLL